MTLAPIVLFVYNRPSHTQQTIEALQKNELACESELFIYSDAAKNDSVIKSVLDVRAYIKSITGFKKISIIEREANWGLADSIIDGVTAIVNKYEKIIVLEDDLVTSPYFLKFMNEALEFYRDEEKVWHISGWNYPIETETTHDVFLWRVMNCWGWATWANKWAEYEKDVDKTINTFSRQDIKRFNLDGGENFFGQVVANKQGKVNTWAIFWYATIFQKEGLCLNPVKTLVDNIGLDGSGENCSSTTKFSSKTGQVSGVGIDAYIEEDPYFLRKIKEYYTMNKKSKCNEFIDRIKQRYKKE